MNLGRGEARGPHQPKNAPGFILGAVTVKLGTPQTYTLRIWHNREAFKPTRLYAHLPEPKAFILEKVVWGTCKEEQVICPVDLAEFGMGQQGLELALPRLEKGEVVIMTVKYTGHTPAGLREGNQFSLPIVWAEPGASLLKSDNATLNYSVE